MDERVGAASTIAGILVGGRALRMGGRPKGLLRVESGETLVERWLRLFERVGLRCYVVGRSAAYAESRCEMLNDASIGEGPIGGLIALLERAAPGRAIAVACDMPYVSQGMIERLVSVESAAPVVAPRRQGLWEPWFARYDTRRVLPIAKERALRGEMSLQGLLGEVGACELTLRDGEAGLLDDWDCPEDIR